MARYRICVVGGWCGNRIVMVADHLSEMFSARGFDCRVTTHSIWENPAPPNGVDLILQLMPAFTEAEAGVPIISVKPLILDLDHPATITRILDHVGQHASRAVPMAETA